MDYNTQKLSITAWAEADRPREKLQTRGKHALSDAELIAILLGSGSSGPEGDTAVSLAQKILKSVGNDLNELGTRSIADLSKFRGMGPAKSIGLIAAMELGRRRQMTAPRERPQIKSSRDAYNCLSGRLMDLPHEEFLILCLNRANKVTTTQMIGRGGVTGVIADPKVIFKTALEFNATAVILAHNHPSGNCRPSDADLQITKKISAAGKVLEIGVLDHIIVAGNDYYSFADQGRMNG